MKEKQLIDQALFLLHSRFFYPVKDNVVSRQLNGSYMLKVIPALKMNLKAEDNSITIKLDIFLNKVQLPSIDNFNDLDTLIMFFRPLDYIVAEIELEFARKYYPEYYQFINKIHFIGDHEYSILKKHHPNKPSFL